MKILTEYYKYHNDIPRLYMIPECRAFNEYHNNKRKYNYKIIKKLIRDD